MKNTQLLTSYARRIYRANNPKFYSCIDQPLANQIFKLRTHTLKTFSAVLPTRKMFKMCVGTFDEKIIKICQNTITLAAFSHNGMVLNLCDVVHTLYQIFVKVPELYSQRHNTNGQKYTKIHKSVPTESKGRFQEVKVVWLVQIVVRGSEKQSQLTIRL